MSSNSSCSGTSAMTQIVTVQQIIPFTVAADPGAAATSGTLASYEYEPDEAEILAALGRMFAERVTTRTTRRSAGTSPTGTAGITASPASA